MEKLRHEPQLNPSRVNGSEYARTCYVATVEMGTSQEDLSNPSFWAHIAHKFRPFDKIEVRAEDGTFYGEYLVLTCDRTWAKVKQLSFYNLTTSDISQTQAEAIASEYITKFRGPRKWSVLRTADNSILQENMLDEDGAKQWLDTYLKTQSVSV